jgi:hypothetical protein
MANQRWSARRFLERLQSTKQLADTKLKVTNSAISAVIPISGAQERL